MVKRHTLLLASGIVWALAGMNILRIGLAVYPPYVSVIRLFLSLLVFAAFMTMFYRLVKKNVRRIRNMEDDRQPLYRFFDGRSYLVMAFMMSLGIALRAFHLVPDVFIAVFYTGLGAALLSAGILFLLKGLPAA